jgi:hypothetical protein
VKNLKNNKKVQPYKRVNYSATHNLEDYEPGASQAQVFEALKKVVRSSKPPEKRKEPPAPASS